MAASPSDPFNCSTPFLGEINADSDIVGLGVSIKVPDWR